MKGWTIGVALAAGGAMLAGCGERRDVAIDEAVADQATPQSALSSDGDENPEWPRRDEFVRQIQEIAELYRREFTIVSPVPKWAPTLCSAVAAARVAPRPKMSASRDPSTHGQKLYYLFASHLDQYIAPTVHDERLRAALSGGQFDAPVGITLVKQSWTPKRVETQAEVNDPFTRVVEFSGSWYTTDEQRELFIMTRLDPSTPNTDNGWVYATVVPDTLEVIAAGRIESCMECHRANGEGRLFGVPREEAERIVRLSILGERN